jgi:hypothetical protein
MKTKQKQKVKVWDRAESQVFQQVKEQIWLQARAQIEDRIRNRK